MRRTTTFTGALAGASIFLLQCASPASAEVLGPGTISDGNVYGGHFAPGDREFYFFKRVGRGETYRIMHSRLGPQGWGAPRPLIIGTAASDLYPVISADGSTMIFVSYRPMPGRKADERATGLWMTRRQGNGWGAPIFLDATTPAGHYVSQISFGPDQALLFRATGPGTSEPVTYIASRTAHGFGPPRQLEAPPIDLPPNERLAGHRLSPDGQIAVLETRERDPVTKRDRTSDLWLSQRGPTGSWLPAKRLNGSVNSNKFETFAGFSSDGSRFHFVRDFAVAHILPVRSLGFVDHPAYLQPIPFLYDDQRVWLQTSVGGRGPYSAILDTGAWKSGVDQSVAEELKVTAGRSFNLSGAGSGSSQVGLLPPTGIDISATKLTPKLVVAPLRRLLDATTGRKSQAIVGSDLFKAHDVEIDFDHGLIYLAKPGSFEPDAPMVEVPLEISGDVPYAEVTLDLPNQTSKRIRAMVDLGAKSTLLLTEPAEKRLKLAEALPGGVVVPLGAGIGGPTRYRFARASSVGLGSVALRDIPVGISVGGTLRSANHDALLGAEFLRNFRVAFSYSRSKMWLSPRKSFPPPPAFDGSGLFITASGPNLTEYIVAEVIAGSPAFAAGATKGDRILFVDGAKTTGMTLGQLRDRLKWRGSDNLVVLTVQRAGTSETREVEVRLRDLLSSAPSRIVRAVEPAGGRVVELK